MTAPLFTTNDAEFTQLEGVYIKETDPPAGVTEQSLNVVATFGTALKGPIGRAVVITSESRFIDVFGGGYLDGVLVSNVWKSILNKGFSRLIVARVAAAAAVKASFTVETAAGGAGTAIARLDASSVGAWGNKVGWKVEAATDGNVNHWNLRLKDNITGRTYLFENFDTSTTNDNTATVLGADTDANLITITKLAAGRPVNSAAGIDGADSEGYTLLGQTVAAFTSVAGADGTVAEGDYYGAGKGLDLVKAYSGVAVVYPAEFMSANLKAQIKTAAAASSDRIFLIGANSETVDVSTAITDVATYRGDRLVYCYNHGYTIDPVSGAEVLVRPESWMAAALANTDVDIHPGEADTKRFLAGLTRLYFASLVRADYVSLRAAGISAMEIDLGSAVFVSGVTTDLTSGKTEITRRRMADYLQLSAAFALRNFVKKKSTEERRRAMTGMLMSWLGGLKRAARVVEDFTVDGEILNTPANRAAGIEKVLMRVKLIGHMLHVVVQTEIGTGVVIAN